MRRCFQWSATILGLSVATPVFAQPAVGPRLTDVESAAIADSVRQSFMRMNGAWEAFDADAELQFFSPLFTFAFDGEPLPFTGERVAALREEYGRLKRVGATATVTVTIRLVDVVTRDVVIVQGLRRLSIREGAAGEPVTRSDVFASIGVRETTGWHHSHLSSVALPNEQ